MGRQQRHTAELSGNALALPPEGDASYVEPASAAFDAMHNELKELEEQIGTLGLTMLARPKTYQSRALPRR